MQLLCDANETFTSVWTATQLSSRTVYFMSKFCQDAKPNDPRSVHNDVMETVLYFCKHTVEDNRMSCIKFGEDVFYALLQLYNASGHESAVKERFLDFCLLQMTIRNPDGVVEGDSQALASSWDLWKRCIRSILICKFRNLIKKIKNTLIFIPHGRSTLLLQSFVSLFVEVSKQLLNYKEHIPSSDPSEHPQKRIKLEMTFEFFVQEIQATKSWIWIKLTGALLDKYPEVIDGNLFLQLLKLLHSLQCEEKDTNTTNYIYECQGILIDVQNRLNFDSKDEIDSIWRLIGESTLSAVGLNQSIEETQILLQKLIKNNYIDLESAVQIYKPGVLTVTKYHLSTTERILEQTNFAELTKAKRINFLHSLLSFENVKDPKCFLEPNFAKILVALILKQYPDGDINIPKERCDKFLELKTLYAKSSFSLNHLLLEENKDKSKDATRIYNTENEIIDSVSHYIETLVQNSNSKNTGCRLCIFGLLYNILNKLIEYKIITEDTMEENEIFVILKRIINKDNLIEEIMKYQKQDVKLLREVLEVASILDTIWSIRNHITDSVKNVFSLPFLQALFEIVNFLQSVKRKLTEKELDWLINHPSDIESEVSEEEPFPGSESEYEASSHSSDSEEEVNSGSKKIKRAKLNDNLSESEDEPDVDNNQTSVQDNDNVIN
ncbi:uncharacterized protein LOC115884724 [Sitophilus oryzae]|uniref:Uncharacterized protein LOC115884724 n=1 Tax=Sitophilus oryzae TaxID=7048 RepID=A0A6J2Y5X1_SITOR|nr:uncharacterized protein LOC115884724 [Sitophilus oryzae]